MAVDEGAADDGSRSTAIRLALLDTPVAPVRVAEARRSGAVVLAVGTRCRSVGADVDATGRSCVERDEVARDVRDVRMGPEDEAWCGLAESAVRDVGWGAVAVDVCDNDDDDDDDDGSGAWSEISGRRAEIAAEADIEADANVGDDADVDAGADADADADAESRAKKEVDTAANASSEAIAVGAPAKVVADLDLDPRRFAARMSASSAVRADGNAG